LFLLDKKTTLATPDLEKVITESSKIFVLVKAFQRRGHELADLDPLRINKKEIQSGLKKSKKDPLELDHKYYGFTDADLNREFYLNPEIFSGIIKNKHTWKLGELIETLKKIYCGKAGFEYLHITDIDERNWLRDQIENLPWQTIENEKKLKIFSRLCKNECFTNFLKNKFSTSKRFGVEGLDSMISGLRALLDKATQQGVKRVVFGMAHRGRLNTLSEVIGKTYEEILCEFQESKPTEQGGWGNSGDVKYHLGTTTDMKLSSGRSIRLAMLPNPSHLEAVNPLVQGKVRATQDYYQETERNETIAVTIHGDAAFAGQGVVYETIQMYDLEDYKVGGTIHIISNNQIGFTTTQRDARSGLYCTDIGKAAEAPIFHVNADEPELVDQVLELALAYRLKFKKDVVVDIVGYRRFGHNELDQPAFTQPLMYQIINKTKPVFEKYCDKLLAEGVLTKEVIQENITKNNKRLDQAYEKSRTQKFEQENWILKPAEDILESFRHGPPRDTGVEIPLLKELGTKITTLPDTVKAHPQVKKIYEARYHSIQEGKGIDWATAESLAFASLIHDGYGVRLSGEDVERGTFSHRHAVIWDQTTDAKYVPMKQLVAPEDRYRVTFSNSHLSEFGVLGFEYGHSLANPNFLSIWEAQFGDFANEAQVIIDNFLASGESKWGTQSGLVLLLPHGYDGQGPEHSSARLERFLELSDDDIFNIPTKEQYKSQKELPFLNCNIQVCVPTTASNYFHLLRRQLRRNFRKPLVVMAPKKLLKYKGAASDLDEFKLAYRFRRVLYEKYPEELVEPAKVRKVICCSGQVYYDLLDARRNNQIKDTAILRFEQISPFPYDRVRLICESYPNAKIVWCQEEHFNMGAFSFVQPRFNVILKEYNKQDIKYFGRHTSAASATGLTKTHNKELQQFLKEVYEYY